MTRSATEVCIFGTAVVFAAIFGCSSGKVIHLGDGKGQGGRDARDAAVGESADAGDARDSATDEPVGVGGSGGADAGGMGGNKAQGGRGARDAAVGGSTSAGGNGGADAGCPHGQVKASEVLWIGDDWIAVPGNQHTLVRDYARAKGAIGSNDDYVIAGFPENTLMPEQTMDKVVAQYSDSKQNAGATQFKVLIMNGGTVDPVRYAYSPFDPVIENVVNLFTDLLNTVAADGTIEHVIYFLCPELPGFAGNTGIQALRTSMRETCEKGPVDCHFLDLQDSFANHPEYIGIDRILPSTAGGQVIADQIWRVMQEHCIEQ